MRTKEKTRKYISILVTILIILSFNTSHANIDSKLIQKSQELENLKSQSEEQKNFQEFTYNNIKLIDSVKRSTYNKLVGDAPTLESKYSLVDKLPKDSLAIRDQKNTSLCWAFSYANVLDATAALKNKKAYRFSAIHSDYVATKYFNKAAGGDGNFEIALATSVSGEGPVYEEDMPFDDYYKEKEITSYEISYDGVASEDLQARAKINETYISPAIYKSYDGTSIKYQDSKNSETQYSEDEVKAIRTQIKQYIKNYGALFTSTYLPTDEEEFAKTFKINEDNSISYCCKNTSFTQNHAVTIIGWDDNYSKDNFADSSYKPLNDGAYLVLNSAGDSAPYYYISYEDYFIEQFIRGIKDLQVYSEEKKNYDNLYQYDELGQSFYYYEIGEEGNLLDKVYASNVFSRKDKTKKEYLTEIGIYVPITEGIEIYVDAEDGDMKNYGEVVAAYTGKDALESGYHSIKLGNPIEITGEKFAVIIKYINGEGAAYSIECNIEASGLSSSELYSKAKAEVGQSFLSIDGNSWKDINGYEIPFYDLETNTLVQKTYKNTNACIKAFTTVEKEEIPVPVTGVTLDKEELTIEKGKTETIKATVAPTDATNKNVKWESSDESIATVNSGVITGVKEGKADITATTEDGNKVATCEVTVIEPTEEPVPVTGVTLDKEELTIEKGKTESIKAAVAPTDATNKNVKWESSDESIATVNSGVITGVKEGKADITATTEDGNKVATCEVTVIEPTEKPVSVESIELNKTKESIEVESKLNLIVTFNPTNATNRNVKWTSSNEKVATVNSNGVVTGLSEGKATITVISEDGNKEATCEVTVTKKINKDDDIYKENDNKESTEKDDTVAKEKLPDTGKILICIIILGVLTFATIKFVSYRKYKNI